MRYFICIFLCFGISFDAFCSETFILKFTSGSKESIDWRKSGRKGTIESLQKVLDTHNSKPYVRDALITLMKIKSKSEVLLQDENPLERIAVIEYAMDIPLQKVLNTIRALPFVEYAEKLSEHSLIEIPNDPFYGYQYYPSMIGADSAWTYYLNQSQKDSVLIAIVDTGIDPLHEDLASVIYINPGESGTDSIGNNKSANGIDDDKNGFIDDWQGWDFASSIDPIKGDNRAVPGHLHGTHVAGIACAITNNQKGIAGIARNHKVLPVKVGYDDSSSVTVSGSYEGMLYASLMGADIINCSWGSPTASMAEQEIVNEVLRSGSMIIGGAGNDRQETAFYPASYPGVINVAALAQDSVKASYSNVHGTVDISAPGSFIYSTVLGNSYGFSSGTSMAAPIVAGVAGLIKSLNPTYSVEQIAGILKASAIDISEKNPEHQFVLGAGMVNAYKAVSIKNPRFAEITQNVFTDLDNDGMFTPGEKVNLSLVLHNVLEDADSCILIIRPFNNQYPPIILNDTIVLGNVKASTMYAIKEKVNCILPLNAPFNHSMKVRIDILSKSEFIGRGMAELIINPTYRTMRENDMHVTVSSQGHIGYNDYPFNLQGIGLSLPPHDQSLLFESGCIIASSAEKLSNGVRDISGNDQERSFFIRSSVNVLKPGFKSDAEAYSEFADSIRIIDAGVSVQHRVYQSKEEGIQKTLFVTYDIQNERDVRIDSLYGGMFFDWDIGPSGQHNIVMFDQTDGFAYCFNTVDSTLPHIGVSLLNDLPIQFHAIDNDGRGNGFSIYDGFSRNEKWFALSGGVSREISRSTDISMVIGGGPFVLDPDMNKTVSFAIVAGNSKEDVRAGILNARNIAFQKGIASGFTWNVFPKTSRLIDVSIGVDEQFRIDFELSKQSEVMFELFSIQGKSLRALEKKKYSAGQYSGITLPFSDLPSGVYFMKMITPEIIDALPCIIVR
jgi:serine protease